MTRLNCKIVLCISVSMFFFIHAEGQKGVTDGSRYGHGNDSIQCIRNLVMYQEYTRRHNYAMAFPYWKVVFDECPLATKDIYIDGARMIHDKLDVATSDKQHAELMDTLMLIYNRRIKYFGQEGYVRGRQGADLLHYQRNGDTTVIHKAYRYLNESVKREGVKSSEEVLITYVSAALILYQDKIFNAERAIKDYLRASSIVDQQLKTKPNNKELQLLKKNINKNFVSKGPSGCKNLISIFSKEIDTRKNDTDFLKMVTTLLSNSQCKKEDLYYKASSDLYKLKPTAELAANIASRAYNSGKFDEAIQYYQQALQLESVKDKKADDYYGIALAYSRSGDKIKSREFARKASEARPNWGDPHLLIGQLYANSKDECSSIKLPNAVFWAAVDEFIKAKSVDPSVEEKANNLISTYSAYFPNKEKAFFQNVIEGDTYKIGCWINESTKARFNK